MKKLVAVFFFCAALGATQPAGAAGTTSQCDQSADQGFKGPTVGPVQNVKSYLSVDADTTHVYVRFAAYPGDPATSQPQTVAVVSANASGATVSGRRAGTSAGGVSTNAQWNVTASQQGVSACVADPDRQIGVQVP